MNEEQVKSALRTLVATFGGAVAGFFAAKGWFTVDQVLTTLNSGTFIGLVTSIIVGIWGLFVHKQANAVAVVNAMPEVRGVVTTPTIAGRALAASVVASDPAAISTVVTAGTARAADVASVSAPPFAGGVFA